MKKIIATADLHGHFPKIPECDLLLIAGDVCPIDQSHGVDHQRHWLREAYFPWLEKMSKVAKDIVWIAGNHDFVCETPGFHRVANEAPATYLRDESVTIDGVKIYGLPWVPNLPNWAFYADDISLANKYRDIPDDTDILLAHGPVNSHLDEVVGGRHVGAVGCASQLQRICPELMVFGHIHEAYGTQKIGDLEFANVAHMNENYLPINKPVEFNWA